MLTVPLSLLVAHFVGDFLLQSDWMALNKSKNWGALAAHSYVYAMSMLLAPVIGGTTDGEFAMKFVVITFVTHFIQDAITSRITGKLWFFKPLADLYPTLGTARIEKKSYPIYVPIGGNRHWFFVMIGFDQLLHFGVLTWTLKLLT